MQNGSTYQYRFKATDNSGNVGVDPATGDYIFTVDTVPPVISTTSSSTIIKNFSTDTVQGSVNDLTSGVNVFTSSSSLGGTATIPSLPLAANSSGNWSHSIANTNRNGFYGAGLTLNATDVAGNATGNTNIGVTVAIDPVITSLTTGPVNGSGSQQSGGSGSSSNLHQLIKLVGTTNAPATNATFSLTALYTPSGGSQAPFSFTSAPTISYTTGIGSNLGSWIADFSSLSQTLQPGSYLFTLYETITGLGITTDSIANSIKSSAFQISIGNDAPILTNDFVTSAQTSVITGNVLVNDGDSNGDILTVTGFTINGYTTVADNTYTIANVGDIVIHANGNYTFTPLTTFAGVAPTITYTVSDGFGSTNQTANLVLTVNPNAPTVSLINDTYDSTAAAAVAYQSDKITSIPNLNGFAATGATINITDTTNGNFSGTTIADASGNWNFTPTVTGSSTQGNHSFSVTSTAPGIATPSTATSFSLTFDNVAPVFSISSYIIKNFSSDKVQGSVNDLTSGVSSFTANSTLGGTATIPSLPLAANSSGNWSHSIANTNRNNYYSTGLTLNATDVAGNATGNTNIGVTVAIDPVITSLTTGPVNGSGSITQQTVSNNGFSNLHRLMQLIGSTNAPTGATFALTALYTPSGGSQGVFNFTSAPTINYTTGVNSALGSWTADFSANTQVLDPGSYLFTLYETITGLGITTDSRADSIKSSTLQVTIGNNNPTAGDRYYTTMVNDSLSLMPIGWDNNIVDADGDIVRLYSINGTNLTSGSQSIPVSGGNIQVDSGRKCTFVPNANFSGLTSFNYVIDDQVGGTVQKDMTIDVVAPFTNINWTASNTTPMILNPSDNNTFGPLNWSGGEIVMVYNGSNFGNNYFSQINVSGPVTLTLVDGTGSNNLNMSTFTSGHLPIGSYTLATTLAAAGLNNITIRNLGAFTSVIPNATNGIAASYDSNGNVTLNINIKPIDLAVQGGLAENTASAITAALSSIQGAYTAGEGAGSGFALRNNSSMYLLLKGSTNKNDHFSRFLNILSATDADNKRVKFKGNNRFWMLPYTQNVTNSVEPGNILNVHNQGILMGASHYFKKLGAILSGLCGMGNIKAQSQKEKTNTTTSRAFTIGACVSKKFAQGSELISNVYAMKFLSKQNRLDIPDPTASYIAKAQYQTSSLSSQSELGHVYKLKNNCSLKPILGFKAQISKRNPYKEYNLPIYRVLKQKSEINKSLESLLGLGFRREWGGEDLEGKITMTYQIGRTFGNRRFSTKLYTQDNSQSVTFEGKKAGLTTHYINIYGSLLSYNNNLKLIPGATLTFQKGQKSETYTLKLEYRW